NQIQQPPYQQLTTPHELHTLLKQHPTSLLILNSVCPCPRPIAPPAPSHPLHYHKLPHPLLTVFAPQHKELTQQPT
ncbi:BrxA/BrxB family bacilliredoxin, partial [Staphylococcus capitis]|uniref:BrxA/BrxB family bacilliredoxin n=1 Tax=Staphylococcus capitis TaxID=29388 RepID=UPI0016425A7C